MHVHMTLEPRMLNLVKNNIRLGHKSSHVTVQYFCSVHTEPWKAKHLNYCTVNWFRVNRTPKHLDLKNSFSAM